jgi:hypothetical protein
MNKEFIPYEQALELKELGFDEERFTYNDNSKIFRAGVLYQQAFRWFREKYKLHYHIEYIGASNQYQWHIKHYWETFDTYEEAELSCLKKLIEMVKGKEVSTQCNTFN